MALKGEQNKLYPLSKIVRSETSGITLGLKTNWSGRSSTCRRHGSGSDTDSLLHGDEFAVALHCWRRHGDPKQNHKAALAHMIDHLVVLAMRPMVMWLEFCHRTHILSRTEVGKNYIHALFGTAKTTRRDLWPCPI